MAIEDGRRVIDQDQSLVIFPEDSILIDSVTNGTRQITYEALCQAVAQTLGIAAIKQTADGAMQKSSYDKDGDGIVDNAAALDKHPASYFAKDTDLQAVKKTADGAMQASKYDADGDGVVDNAEKVNNHTVDADVPSDAKFTDTTYDDKPVKESIEKNAKAIEQNSNAIKDLQSGIGLSVVDGKIQQTITVQ